MVFIKRRVIQVANSTQLISLPRKWAEKYNIKKGDELEITEQGSKILVSTDKGVSLEAVEIDVTGLDRSSIMYYIRGVYRAGYDEIRVVFNEPTTVHYRANEKKTVISVIHQEVNRLVGIEIVQQKDNFCMIKDLSQSPATEFDTVLRRVFLLISDVMKEFLVAMEKKDTVLIQTLEEKHNSITKFISYCLRLLNKRGHPDVRKIPSMYHIIASLDKITDVIKYSARYYLEVRPKLEKEDLIIMHGIQKSMEMYSDFFYRFDKEVIGNLYKNRDAILSNIKKTSIRSKASCEKVLLLNNMEQILEMLVHLTEARIGLEY